MRKLQSIKQSPEDKAKTEMRIFLKKLDIEKLNWKEALKEIKAYLPPSLIKIDMKKGKYRIKFTDTEIHMEMKDSTYPGLKRPPSPQEVKDYLNENHPDRVEVYEAHLEKMNNLTKILDDHSHQIKP